jgi:hypothetical protein
MFVLKIKGPFKVPCYVGKGGRSITDGNIDEFWESNRKYEEKRGCCSAPL